MQIDIKNQKIILDVDTGVDDALAILLLAKIIPEQILGITTCGGNVELNQVNKNTLGVLSLQEKLIKVYVGSSKTIENREFNFAKDYHGENGLCGIEYKTNQKPEIISACDFIISSAETYPNNLTLINIGPVTNLAKSLMKRPEIASKINQVVMMGGAVEVEGNETDFAEFNFYQDPEAVKIVFEKIKNIYLVPLDVTGKCLIKKEDLAEFNSKSRVGKFVIKLINNWYKFFGDYKNRFFELYDPLVASAILGDFLEFSKEKLDIETKGNKRGGLIKGEGREISYASKVKSREFINFFKTMINDDQEKPPETSSVKKQEKFWCSFVFILWLLVIWFLVTNTIGCLTMGPL